MHVMFSHTRTHSANKVGDTLADAKTNTQGNRAQSKQPCDITTDDSLFPIDVFAQGKVPPVLGSRVSGTGSNKSKNDFPSVTSSSANSNLNLSGSQLSNTDGDFDYRVEQPIDIDQFIQAMQIKGISLKNIIATLVNLNVNVKDIANSLKKVSPNLLPGSIDELADILKDISPELFADEFAEFLHICFGGSLPPSQDAEFANDFTRVMKKLEFRAEEISTALNVLGMPPALQAPAICIRLILKNNGFSSVAIVRAMLAIFCSDGMIIGTVINLLKITDKNNFVKVLKDAGVKISKSYNIFIRAAVQKDGESLKDYLSELVESMKYAGYSVKDIAKLFRNHYNKLELSQLIGILKNAGFMPQESGNFLQIFSQNLRVLNELELRKSLGENSFTPDQQEEVIKVALAPIDSSSLLKIVQDTRVRLGEYEIKILEKPGYELTTDDFIQHKCDVIIDSNGQAHYIDTSHVYVKSKDIFDKLPHEKKLKGTFVYDGYGRVFQYVNEQFIRIRPQNTEYVKEQQQIILGSVQCGDPICKLSHEILGDRAIRKIDLGGKNVDTENVSEVRKYLEKYGAMIPGIRPDNIRAIYSSEEEIVGYRTPKGFVPNPTKAILGSRGTSKQIELLSKNFSKWAAREATFDEAADDNILKPFRTRAVKNPKHQILAQKKQWVLEAMLGKPISPIVRLSEKQLELAKVPPNLRSVGLYTSSQSVEGDNQKPELDAVLGQYPCFVTTFKVAKNVLISVKHFAYEYNWENFNILSYKNMTEAFDGAFRHRRLCHHDLKPGNLVYNYEKNSWYIIDWESAKLDKDFANGVNDRTYSRGFAQTTLLKLVERDNYNNPKRLIQVGRSKDLSGLLLTMFHNYACTKDKLQESFFAVNNTSRKCIEDHQIVFDEFMEECIAPQHQQFVRQFLSCEDRDEMRNELLPRIYNETEAGPEILEFSSLLNWPVTA